MNPNFLFLLALWPAVLPAQPANNDFANAQPLSGWSGSVTGSTASATKEISEPNHGGNPGGASVWYVWDAPGDGAAEFDLHNSDFDTTLSAYTGLSLAGLTPVAQNDDEFEYFPLISRWLLRDLQSRIRFPAHAGTRYYIGVDGIRNMSGNIMSGNIMLGWNLKSRPANDNFAEAQVITGAEGFISTHNVGATKELGEPDHATNAGSASIWYRWTAPMSGTTRFFTLFSLTSLRGDLDTLLAVYTSSNLTALTLVAANDDIGNTLGSFVQFPATAGTTYQIVVDTKAASTNHGHVLLTWINGTPTNNNFTNAHLLTGSCGLVQGHNTFANKETGELPIAGNAGGASIWYSWMAPTNGATVFTTLGSPFVDTLLAVYTGTTVNALTRVVENDDVSGGFLDNLFYSRVEFVATAGTTYRISIDGFHGGASPPTGVSFLQWALQPPANNNFTNAQILSGASGTLSGCNSHASKEIGEPDHAGNDGGRSVWYQWQTPTSGVATVDLAGSLFNTVLAVYRANGSTVDSLTLVGQNDDRAGGFDLAFHSRVEFQAAAGVTYYIAVDGVNDGAGYISDGWITLNYNLRPAPVLQITRSGQSVIINWNGRLESTPLLNDPASTTWTTVPGASPLTLPVSSMAHQFFRAVHP